MKNIYLLSFVLFVALLSSCSDKEDPIGKWDDNIKLSTKSAEFNAKSDSIIIKTEGDWWWIEQISLDNNGYQYYNRPDIDLESTSYSIKEADFVIERRDKNTLFIKLDENSTGKERIMTISLEAGDYFDYINIKQLAN